MALFLAAQAFCSGPLRARLKLIASRVCVSRRPQDSVKEFWNGAQVDSPWPRQSTCTQLQRYNSEAARCTLCSCTLAAGSHAV